MSKYLYDVTYMENLFHAVTLKCRRAKEAQEFCFCSALSLDCQCISLGMCTTVLSMGCTRGRRAGATHCHQRVKSSGLERVSHRQGRRIKDKQEVTRTEEKQERSTFPQILSNYKKPKYFIILKSYEQKFLKSNSNGKIVRRKQ